MEKFLIDLGVVTLIFIILGVYILISTIICGCINNLIYKYEYKHRFDKPPLAACYCIDCKHYGSKVQHELCTEHRYYTKENGFCSEAVPRGPNS